ncbi:MAG: amidohydrolase family protein [Devosia sp.]|uniref:amidohydrolase family protein n=1 Tax=Devosia sp. TaxID=1871048 RepID=UPI001A46DD90|nr:amidohydrolase family protein [Devosia sp.]MBL8599749.1 amidohydrolase family protein [Devosia sp.]
MSEYETNSLDTRIWQEELEDFVPHRVFDAHVHIYRWAFDLDPNKASGPFAGGIGAMFPEVTWEIADAVDAALMPGRQIERLAFPFPFPSPCDFDGSNDYIASEVAKGGDRSRGLMLVRPQMSAAQVEADVRRLGVIGFKPYRWYAPDAVEGRLTDFMPEHQIAVADKLGLVIMMHLSKRDAIADPENVEDLLRLSDKYPNAKWILAHCARSYSSWAIEASASKLRGLPNVWYDTSTVCDSDALDALYTGVGVDRVMYGSDDMIGPMRGKYITFGRAWAYLSPTNHAMSLAHCDPRMTFTRYEQLRAMKRGGRQVGLTAAHRQALFYDTARALVDSVPVPQGQ